MAVRDNISGIREPKEICSFVSPMAPNVSGTTTTANTVVTDLQLPSLDVSKYKLVITTINTDTGNTNGMNNPAGLAFSPNLVINSASQLTITGSANTMYWWDTWGSQWLRTTCNGKVYYIG